MILITTPVAQFEMYKVSNVSMSIGNQIAMGQRYALREPSWRVEVYNDAGVLAFGAGPIDIAPLVWSHTPFPWGMHPEIIQGHFEDRAAGVLGNLDSKVGYGKNPDGSYLSHSMLCAWMMYVDLAIEHYSTKV